MFDKVALNSSRRAGLKPPRLAGGVDGEAATRLTSLGVVKNSLANMPKLAGAAFIVEKRRLQSDDPAGLGRLHLPQSALAAAAAAGHRAYRRAVGRRACGAISLLPGAASSTQRRSWSRLSSPARRTTSCSSFVGFTAVRATRTDTDARAWANARSCCWASSRSPGGWITSWGCAPWTRSSTSWRRTWLALSRQLTCECSNRSERRGAGHGAARAANGAEELRHDEPGALVGRRRGVRSRVSTVLDKARPCWAVRARDRG